MGLVTSRWKFRRLGLTERAAFAATLTAILSTTQRQRKDGKSLLRRTWQTPGNLGRPARARAGYDSSVCARRKKREIVFARSVSPAWIHRTRPMIGVAPWMTPFSTLVAKKWTLKIFTSKPFGHISYFLCCGGVFHSNFWLVHGHMWKVYCDRVCSHCSFYCLLPCFFLLILTNLLFPSYINERIIH